MATTYLSRVGLGEGFWACCWVLGLGLQDGDGLMASADPGAMAQPGSHILLTVLGINPRKSIYSLGERRFETLLAPLALIQLLPEAERPDTVVALCTPEALQDSWPILKQGLPSGCSARPVEVPPGHSQQDIQLFLQKATEAIPGSSASQQQLSLDVTHGFRHFSFLTYLAGLYLVSLRSVALKGAWYGLLQPSEPSPFLDLKPLLALPRWIHALQVLKETGSALPIADALRDDNAGQQAKAMASELSQISDGYLSGLPLELGRQVHLFRSQNKRLRSMPALLEVSHHLPLAKEIVGQLDLLLEPFELQVSGVGSGWKSQATLSLRELQRQSLIIDGLFSHGDNGTAVGLLNEWTVSWALWCLERRENWLDYYQQRLFASSRLNAILAAGQDRDLKLLLTQEQQEFGVFWGFLKGLRNGFHHHGMRPEDLIGDKKISRELEKVRAYWDSKLRSCPRLSLVVDGGFSGSLLVSPIGSRPGVLSSALHACRTAYGRDPVMCMVICSKKTQPFITDAMSRVTYQGEIIPLLLEDPYGGKAEIKRLAEPCRKSLFCAEEVFVNVTGGTTLMGLLAQNLADLARSFARPVRRFGLIDRRSSSEQADDPYQLGEPFWLDGQAEADS